MKTYLSILRGINVGGKRIIKMDALRQLFVELGFQNIQTYIQSGNVIFQSRKIDLEKLEQQITEAIGSKFNLDVPVIVKACEELKQVIESNPFLNDQTKDTAHLHLTFLSEKPDQLHLTKIKNDLFLPDEFQIIDQVVYLYCPNSYSNSKLTNRFFETNLKTIATTRNWKTANELLNITLKINSLH